MGRLVRAAGGGILIALALALSFPGVQAVRAETEPAAAGDGPMCRADAPLAPPGAIDRVAEQLAASAAVAGEPGRPEIRVLNGRGYSYRPANREVDLSALAREIAVRKRQGR